MLRDVLVSLRCTCATGPRLMHPRLHAMALYAGLA